MFISCCYNILCLSDAQAFLVSAGRTQCWNSRHADINFLCFQPIARYNFLSDEVEEQSDTHQLCHDARHDANAVVHLALTMVVEGEGKVV